MAGKYRYHTIGIISVILFLILACAGPGTSNTNSQDLKSTEKSLSLRATSLKLEQMQATLDAPTATPLPPPPTVQPTQPPPTVQPTQPPVVQPTQEPPPPVATQAPPTPEPIQPTPTVDMNAKIRKANVLIFEDIWGQPALSGNRLVSQAIQALNFSGGRVINTGDALGDFKSQLLSGTPWDIIVISAESHNEVKGEFWEYIKPLVDKKVAVVAEAWFLNQISRGKIMPLLQECGIDVQQDWRRDAKFDLLDYSILNYDSSHPIFNTPNSGISLTNPSNIWWSGDVGDLVKLDVGGDAVLLAGTSIGDKSSHGLITSCIEGRVIFQTFCTHDYSPKNMVALWENYIVYTLTRHFEALQTQ